MIVGFRVLSKPVFSKTIIGGAQLHSVVLNTPIPLPTTVAGALGTLLGIRLKVGAATGDLCGELSRLEDLKELYRELRRSTGCKDPCIKGPLTYFEGKPYLNVRELFVPVAHDTLSSISELYSISEDKRSEYVRHVLLRKVGIALERRAATAPKVVKPGFFYDVGASLYIREADKAPVQPVFKYVLEGSINKCEEIVRFGGEGTLAEVLCEDGVAGTTEITESIKSPLEPLSRGTYIALTPIPVIPVSCKPLEQRSVRAEGSLSVDKLASVCFEAPFKFSEIIGLPGSSRNNVVVKPPKARIERLGLGYSESLNMRRPQVLAFPQGTIVRVEEISLKSFSDIMRTLLGIGFASLYKLPL